MADFRSLTLQSGIVTQIQNANSLVVGSGVKTLAGDLGLASFSGDVVLAANNNLKAASGTGQLDFSAASGVFKTSTGAVTIGPGAVGVSGAATFSAAGTALTVNNNATVSGVLTAGSVVSASMDYAGVMNIGGTNATAVNIGKTGVTTRIKGDLQVDGAETIVGTSTFQQNATFQGDVQIDGYNFTNIGSAGNFAWGASSGSFTTSSGAVTLSGNTTVSSGKSLTLADLTTGIAHVGSGGLITSSAIVNADVDAAAAIAYSKLNLSGSIVNGDVNASAAIAYSKLNLASSIVNADVNASAAIAYSKLNLSASIVNADIASGAAIAANKLAAGTSGQLLLTNGSTPTWTSMSGDATISNTGVVAVSAATGNFSVGGTLSVLGVATFDDNMIINDGYSLTVNTLTSSTGNNLALQNNGTSAMVISGSALTVQSGFTLGTTGTGMINLPSLFKINGTAVGATVTAANLDNLTDGTNADALHSHAAATATKAPQVVFDTLVTTAVNGYFVGYQTGTAGTMAKAKADSMSTSNVFGVNGGINTEMIVYGAAVLDSASFESGICPANGTVLYLSDSVAGTLTGTAPTASGSCVVRCGIVCDATGNVILFQPMAPVQL